MKVVILTNDDIKPIPHFSGYFITRWGDVFTDIPKGARRDKGGCMPTDLHEVMPRPGKNGYDRVYMRNDETGKRVDRYVHRLVAEAFIPNPENKPVVNHKNCDRSINEDTNLEWATIKENNKQTTDLGRLVRDELGRYKSNI